MAKGDSGKAQNMINTQGTLAQNYLSQLQSQNQQMLAQAQNQMYGSSSNQPNQNGGQTSNQASNQPPPDFGDLSNSANAQKMIDYYANQPGANPSLENDPKYWLGKITSGELGKDPGYIVSKFMTPEGAPAGSSGGASGQNNADYSNIMSQYGDFAKTGGFSPQDLANIRARAISPIRSVYSSAENAIERQKALQGGYSPNYTAAMAKMAREQSQGTSDATTNAEANIAQMKQQGRLAGLGGMSSTYGTTPGLANMYGNQMMGLAGQGLQAGGLQNQLGLGLIGGQINKAGVPSTFSQIMGNIGSVGKAVGGAVAPWL